MTVLLKPVTWILGIVLVIIGILGFFYQPDLYGFRVDTIHNIVHLVSGVIAIWAAMNGEQSSRMYLIVFGIIYAIVTILGVWRGDILGLFPTNRADDYLHAAIAVVSLIIGFASGRKSEAV